MTRHLFALLLLASLVLPQPAAAKDDTRWLSAPSQAPRVERVERGLPPVTLSDGQVLQLDLQGWMETLKVPGLSIAVFDNFQVVWRKSYGVREVGASAPVTLDTTFQAGSVSKPVMALAAMRFVQEGRFNLDENVNDKLLSWKVPDNPFTVREKVTLRRLLSHSAGLSVHGFPGYAVGSPTPTLVQVLNGEKPANTAPVRVVMVPGTKFEYSGGGTLIVQQLLIDQFKKPFPQLMAETVFQPLGLTHSSYEQPQPPARAAMSAVGHHADGKPVEGKWHIYPEMAAGGLWTTPGDLAEVAIEVAKSKHGKSNRILSQESVRQMLTVQMAPLGLGFFLDAKNDRFGHDGDDDGFQTDLVAFSESGQGAAVMANSDFGSLLFEPLMQSLAKEYGWKSYTAEPMRPYLRFILVSRQLGTTKALEDYSALRAKGPEKDFGPVDLNAGGYALLNAGQAEDAIRVFQANVALYPNDSNAYDSLAEGYMTAGKKDLAIRNYEKSLELDPKNKNAVAMLSRLGVTWQPDPKRPAPVY
jgi:CubicO group peptidase (beta-lactamase class C family)